MDPTKWFMHTTYSKIFSAGEIVAKTHPEKDSVYLLLLYFCYVLFTFGIRPKVPKIHTISFECQTSNTYHVYKKKTLFCLSFSHFHWNIKLSRI